MSRGNHQRKGWKNIFNYYSELPCLMLGTPWPHVKGKGGVSCVVGDNLIVFGMIAIAVELKQCLL